MSRKESGCGFVELLCFFKQLTTDKRTEYRNRIDKLYAEVSRIDDCFNAGFAEDFTKVSNADKSRIFYQISRGDDVIEIVKIHSERVVFQCLADKIKNENFKVFVDYETGELLKHHFIDAWYILRTAEFIYHHPQANVVDICSFNDGMGMLPSQLLLILAFSFMFTNNFNLLPETSSRFLRLFDRLAKEDEGKYDLKAVVDRISKQEVILANSNEDNRRIFDDLTVYMKALEIERKEFEERQKEASNRIGEEGFPEVDLTADRTIFGRNSHKNGEKLSQFADDFNNILKTRAKYPRDTASGEFLYKEITTIIIGQEVYVRVIHNDVTKIYLGEIKDYRERITVRLKNSDTNIKEVCVDKSQLGFSRPMYEYILPVGTRVMALFTPRTKEEETEFRKKAVWMPGTVGAFENGEYLIFFDLDVDAYVDMKQVMLHFDQAIVEKRTVSDLDPRVEPRENYKKVNNPPRMEFLKRFLCDKHPPPVHEGRVGESLRAKDGRRRYKSTIIKIKGLLYLLRFPKNDRTSIQDQGHDCLVFNCVKHNHADRWVYKGSSTRLDIPENFKAERRRHHQGEVIELEEDDSGTRHTAKKSTAAPAITTRTTNARAQYNGSANKLSAAKKVKPKQLAKGTLKAPNWEKLLQWTDHEECSPECWTSRKPVVDSYSDQWPKIISPYFKPMTKGWTRVVFKVASMKSKKSLTNTTANRKDYVYYVAPCGRRMHELEDVAIYLRETNSPLPIMYFNMRSALDPESYIKVPPKDIIDKDYSLGMEGVHIQVVNNINSQNKPKMIYNSTRFARSDTVNQIMEESRQARSCCSCTDNCSDKNKCECQQLTINEHNRLDKQLQSAQNCYNFGTLENRIGSGIYECNSKCLCNKDKCFNYVSQRKIEIPIQLFMTPCSGWGVRTLVDIPGGTFISTYSGEILTDEQVEALGAAEGAGRDIYFADMDFYRTMEDEKLKRGFDLPDEGIEEDAPDEIMRRNFNQDHPFTIDAYLEGNIGRFYNHSCNPNMFVQNVFTDTHDFRFPVITFFAGQDIAAGAEITWDYGYNIDEGGRVMCNCGASNCRGYLM